MSAAKITEHHHPIDDMPPEILAEIGKIIAWWGYLQFQLGVIIRESVRVKNWGQVQIDSGDKESKSFSSYIQQSLGSTIAISTHRSVLSAIINGTPRKPLLGSAR